LLPPISKKLTRASEKFVKEAAEGGLLEVELGKLAVEKANHEQVKAFGRQMQDDHGKANEELKTIAAANGVRFPQSPQENGRIASPSFRGQSSTGNICVS
jgi:putative membrane protein